MTRDSRPILVPVDYSAHSEEALVWAAEEARCRKALLVVLHVVHDPAGEPGYYIRAQAAAGRPPRDQLQGIEAAATELMGEFLAGVIGRHSEVGPREALETRLVVGVPAPRILEVAESIDAQLIVMGSQGRTGLSLLMLGSKAEQVVRLSPIPVTIVKAPRDESA